MISQSFSIRQSQSLRLTQAQRVLVVQTHILTLRLALIQALRDEEYKPEAECPKCLRKLTPVEIISGFNQDPNDFTTCCSACGHRFEPLLICLGNGSRLELPFFCDSQVLAQMRGLEDLSPEEFSAKRPAVYRSAIVHHGSIRKAFQKIDIEYPFEEIPDWKNKINGFLGRLPDTVIAQYVDVSVASIRQFRWKLQIPKYTSGRALIEAESEN